ncbi:MAG: hypothetical protein ACON3Z_19090 [Bradymonadia bacterium]
MSNTESNTKTNGKRVVIGMLLTVTVVAGTALYFANLARSLKPARSVPFHLQLQETTVGLKIELDLLKSKLKANFGGTGTGPSTPVSEQAILADKVAAVAKRAARTLKMLPKTIERIAAQARAIRNDPFSKPADKRAAGERIETLPAIETKAVMQLEALRDQAIGLLGELKKQAR